MTDLEKALYGEVEPLHSQVGVSTSEKNVPFGFSGVDDCWETYPAVLADSLLVIIGFGALLYLVNVIKEKQRYTCVLNATSVEFPFLRSSRHCALLVGEITFHEK